MFSKEELCPLITPIINSELKTKRSLKKFESLFSGLMVEGILVRHHDRQRKNENRINLCFKKQQKLLGLTFCQAKKKMQNEGRKKF